MKQLFRWLDEVKSAKVIEDKPLIETTKYKDFAFWWILRNRIYTDLLIFFTSGLRLYRPSSRQRIIGRFTFLYLLVILVQSIISKLISVGQKRNEASHPVLLTAQFESWKPIRDIPTGQLEKAHVIFEPVLKQLRQTRPQLCYVSLAHLGFSGVSKLKQALEMKQAANLGHFRILESYLGINTLARFLYARRHFSRVSKKLQQSQNTKNVPRLNGIDVFTAFSDYFDYYYTTYLPLLVLLYELDLQVCKQEEPALVLLSNEYGGYERALIMAAHAQHIPSLAIQHGIIDEYKAGYMFAANDVSTTGSAHYPFVPIPTNTTVYGSFTKDLLTRSSSFPDNAVVVTGQPRYDSLLHVERLYDKTRFCNRFQIDQQKKLVLITTQPFPMESVREKFILSTIKALNQIQGIQIIVKPHHNETREWYENRVKTQNIIILPPRYDTYEALYACDLLIAQTSTTILEAMILEKEVVVVNLSNLPEVLPWVEEKAVFGVYNEADLVKNFQSALFDKKAQMATQKDRRTFLTKHIFKTDGKSSERVAARILSLLQEKES